MTAAGGGGDSSFTSRPWWQPATASQSTYPIVPDVAAFADASPALWDQKAAQSGWPKLGFVTPLLYSIAHNDAGSFLGITSGRTLGSRATSTQHACHRYLASLFGV